MHVHLIIARARPLSAFTSMLDQAGLVLALGLPGSGARLHKPAKMLGLPWRAKTPELNLSHTKCFFTSRVAEVNCVYKVAFLNSIPPQIRQLIPYYYRRKE